MRERAPAARLAPLARAFVKMAEEVHRQREDDGRARELIAAICKKLSGGRRRNKRERNLPWGGWGMNSADLGPWGVSLVSRCSSFHCKATTPVCRAKTIRMGMFSILR